MTPPPHHSALDAFFAEEAWLHRLARQLVLDDASAKDLVQETWVATMESPQADTTRPRAWLSTVARRIASKQRTRRHPVSTAELDHFLTESAPPEFKAIQQESADRLRRALHALDDPLEQAVRMRFLEGLRMAEIAQRTGRSERTIRKWLNSAKRRVRAELAQDVGVEELGNGSWCVVLAPLLIPSDMTPVGYGPDCTEPELPVQPAPTSPDKPAVASAVGATTTLVTLATVAVLGGIVTIKRLTGGGVDSPPAGDGRIAASAAAPPAPSSGLDPGTREQRQPVQQAGLDGSRPGLVEGSTEQGAQDPTQVKPVALPIAGVLTLDGESPTAFVVSARGDLDGQHLVVPGPEQVAIGLDGSFELLVHAAGTYVLTWAEELSENEGLLGRRNGSPLYHMEVVRTDGEAMPLEQLDIRTGDIVLTGLEQVFSVATSFDGAGWSYSSNSLSSNGSRAQLHLVPEGDVTLTVEPKARGEVLRKLTVTVQQGRTVHLDLADWVARTVPIPTARVENARVAIPPSKARTQAAEAAARAQQPGAPKQGAQQPGAPKQGAQQPGAPKQGAPDQDPGSDSQDD